MKPICYQCQKELTMSNIERRNHSYTGVCHDCKFNHAILYLDSAKYKIQNIQHRFAHKGTKWHMTYRPDSNTTSFVTVQKQPPPQYQNGVLIEQPKIRQEHHLPGFVSKQRFINLLIFT